MSVYNKDLDFTDFAIKILQEIDSIRSNGRGGSSDPQESRINAFYRALGLPGLSTGVGPPEKNNNNMFSNKNIGRDIINPLGNRETLFQANKNFLRNGYPDGYSVGSYKASILDGIDGTRKEQLFPMYTNASVEIYPVGKRVGGAFMTDTDLQDISSNDKTQYRRPLIETIISLRLSTLGIFNSTKQPEISSVYKSFSELAKDITNNLVKTMNNISQKVSEAKQIMDRVAKQTSANVTPDDNPDQNTTVVNNDQVGQLDQKKTQQDLVLAEKQAQLSLFNFSDVVVQNTNGNTSITNISRNLKDASLASTFISIVVSDSDNGLTQKSINGVDDQLNKATSDLKTSFRDLDLVFGTFSGLSGTDVLCVLLALFIIPVETLISLINDDAIVRLNTQTGLGFARSTNGTGGTGGSMSFTDAVTALEKSVRSIMTGLDSDIKQPKVRNQNINRGPNRSK